jgi:hypothetical protein
MSGISSIQATPTITFVGFAGLLGAAVWRPRHVDLPVVAQPRMTETPANKPLYTSASERCP